MVGLGRHLASLRHCYPVHITFKYIQVNSVPAVTLNKKENNGKRQNISLICHWIAIRTPLRLFVRISQHGPATFDLRAILQKRDNSRATSSKMMYETTDSQDLKLKGKISNVSLKLIRKSNNQFITNLYQCDACGWGFSDTIVPLTIPLC